MKRGLLFLIAGVFSGTLGAQVIVTTNFENWTTGTPDSPDGWMGSKSTIVADSVMKVTGGIHSDGMAKLVNSGTSHKRFTTQPVSVTLDQSYDIKVYVSGKGNLRAGLFNGTGFQTYYSSAGVASAYDAVNSNTPVELVYKITSQATSTAAEFILSVQSGVSPDFLMVDSVAIIATAINAPTQLAIASIQMPTGATDESPYKDSLIMTSGIVMGTSTIAKGYWIQDAAAAWSGIFVYDSVTQPNRGDSISLRARVVEFNGLTELSSVNNVVVHSTGNAEFAPIVLSTLDANKEDYEGVLVRVNNAMNVQNLTSGRFNADDGSGMVMVDDLMYFYPLPGQNELFNFIIGIRDYSFSESKILPRDANDMSSAGVGIEENVFEAVKMAPNAVQNELHIMNAEGSVMELVNLNGQVLSTQTINNANATVDMTALSAGTYLVRLSKEGQSGHYQIVKY